MKTAELMQDPTPKTLALAKPRQKHAPFNPIRGLAKLKDPMFQAQARVHAIHIQK